VNVTVCQYHDDGAALEWDRSRARDVARVAHVYVLSSNRAADGGGWIIDPDGALVALTQQAPPFVTVDLEFSAIQAPPAGARGQTTQSSAASRGVA
jgi:hypothetical protein